jgi:hypothetical protein
MWNIEDIIPAEVTPMEKEKYEKYIGNYIYLHNYFSYGVTLAELGIMLKLELEGRKRDFIISRIRGKIGSMYTEYLKKQTQEM